MTEAKVKRMRDMRAAGMTLTKIARKLRVSCTTVWWYTRKVERDVLNPRELKVAVLYSSGLTYRQIAKAVGTTENSVKTRLANARDKMGAMNRMELIQLCFERGIFNCPCCGNEAKGEK